MRRKRQRTEHVGPKFNREALMSPVVSQWLSDMGYSVYAEVEIRGSPVDHIGVRWSDKSIICVEMKNCCTWKVLDQARSCQYITDLVYIAVPSKPQELSIQKIKAIGLGLIVNGVVVIEPEVQKSFVYFKYRERCLVKCERMSEGGTGGLPQLKGDGPAIRCSALIEQYLKQNPSAKWKQMWLEIPNHYASPNSMRGAMKGVRDRIEYERRVKGNNDRIYEG